jgi:hypothetical protein
MEFLGYFISLNEIKINLKKKSISNLRLARITKRDGDLRVYGIRELLLTIY